MSQGFKLKYDQMRESDPTEKNDHAAEGSKAFEEFYAEESPARNICFVWPSGKRLFMNYSYLVSGEYEPDEGRVVLTFTTGNFILIGVNLESLFYEIMDHRAKQITCMDERYNLIGEGERFVVNDIIQKKNSEAAP